MVAARLDGPETPWALPGGAAGVGLA